MDHVRGFSKRPPRIDLRQPVVMINSDGHVSNAIILDVSSTGFRLELADLVRVGELVTLRVEHDEIPGQIRWTLGNEAGGVFLTNADREQVAAGEHPMAGDGHGSEGYTGEERRKGERRSIERIRTDGTPGDRRQSQDPEGAPKRLIS